MAAPLPPGFTLDSQKSKPPPLPPGFMLDPSARKGDKGASPLPGAEQVPPTNVTDEFNTPKPPGTSAPSLKNYDPSFTDRIAQFLIGDSRDPQRQRAVEVLLGTRGLGSSAPGRSSDLGLIDVSPFAAVKGVTDAQKEFGEGHYGQAALDTLSAIPGGKAMRPVVDSIAAKFTRSGVEPTLATTTRSGGAAAKALAGSTLGGSPVRKVAEKSINQAGDQAALLARGAVEPAVAGKNIAQAVEETTTVHAPDQIRANYEVPALQPLGQNVAARPLKQGPITGMDPGVLSTLPETRKVLDTLDKAIENPELKAQLTNKNMQNFVATIKSAAKGGLSFGDIRELRTKIGDLQPSADSMVGINKRVTKALYETLTKDMHSLAYEAGGDAALQAVKRADEYNRAYKAVREPAIEKLVGAGGEDAFKTVGDLAKEGGDWQRLYQIKRSVPSEDWNSVSKTVVDQMGRQGPGVGADVAKFSPTNFVKSYDSLSQRGKEALFPTDLRKALDDLSEVSRRLMPFERGTGEGGIPKAIKRIGGYGLRGLLLFFHPGLFAGEVATEHVASRILASPKVVRFLANVGRAMEAGKPLVAYSRVIPQIVGDDREMAKTLNKIVSGGTTNVPKTLQ